jgi:hypothetical protein
LQDTSEVFHGNLSNVRREASTHYRKKKRGFFKEKLISWSQTVRIRASERCIGA